MERSETPEDIVGEVAEPEVEVESPIYEWLRRWMGWRRWMGMAGPSTPVPVIIMVVALTIFGVYALSVPTKTSAPPPPPPPSTGTLETCAVNQGYDGARLKVWVDGDMMKNEYFSPDDVSCFVAFLDPGSHRVVVWCDFTVRYDGSVYIVAHETVELPREGYSYVCY